MYNNYKIVVFIPVRGESKSIPLKNIKLINSRPLVYWVLDAAKECELVDKIFVSTDSNEIKEVVKKYKSDKVIVIGRSEETSKDTSSTESAMIEFAESYNFQSIILIQATSPLLQSEDLRKGIEIFNKENIHSVLSVVRQKKFIWDSTENEQAVPNNYNPEKRPRRQEFEGVLIENGAFYITDRNRLLRTKNRISGNIGYIEMHEKSFFEVDEPSDWVIVEELLKNREKSKGELEGKLQKIKMVITDSDGVLTDGGMYYSENGDELKKFNTKDGMAIKILREKGIKTGIITGENIKIVKRRAEKLSIDEVHLGISDKLKVLDEILEKYNLNYDEIAYIGDDINDVQVMQKVGFGCSVKDAMECVKNIADFVTNAKGGEGAVREVAELIYKYI